MLDILTDILSSFSDLGFFSKGLPKLISFPSHQHPRQTSMASSDQTEAETRFGHIPQPQHLHDRGVSHSPRGRSVSRELRPFVAVLLAGSGIMHCRISALLDRLPYHFHVSHIGSCKRRRHQPWPAWKTMVLALRG